MRSYIFTEHERHVLKQWLESGIELEGIRMTLSRIRRFKELRKDIELFQRVTKKMEQ